MPLEFTLKLPGGQFEQLLDPAGDQVPGPQIWQLVLAGIEL